MTQDSLQKQKLLWHQNWRTNCTFAWMEVCQVLSHYASIV